MKTKSNFRAKGKAIFLGLALLLVLTACGKSVDALKDAGDVQGLISILGDADEEGQTRKDAALALGEIGDPTAVEPLIRYMQECAETLGAHSSNDEWQACHDAVGPVSEILGRMGDARAVEPLIEMLEEHWVHEEAVQALGMLNDARAILPLIETLDHGTSQFTDMGERYGMHKDVILALAANAPPETFDALRDALPGFHAQQAEKCVKYRLALDALLAMQDPRIETLLLSLLKTYDMDCDAGIPYFLAELWDFDTAKLLPFIKLGNGYSYQSDFAQIYFSQTPKPNPIEVDFASIYDYTNETQVTITGRLLTPVAIVCKPDYITGQVNCNANLANPSNDRDMIGIYLLESKQIKPMPNPYTEENFRVLMDNGEWAVHGTLARITGTICKGGPSLCDITKIEPVK